ncbi:DUF6737 family protein [Thermoleptolyngbya sp. C42_A2020_037]|uniref:DUF6737 family protein n=1 Tax=Thermoleptolyngbya sp. C42_A2020_037 TaxID=2747799 RepID=UPI001A0A7356|nr:DUF6737 family protein [Thermoleptolyngbya sp. C42_A2020_037]MBF2086643.1 hypothetical protein [Thermoleptolyngbya sp. C42_A2020_037]
MTAPQSVWQVKPWWCQPWSIVLTGTGLIGGSWLLLHRVWLTGLVAVPVLAWMGFFVLVYPRLWADAVQGQGETESGV